MDHSVLTILDLGIIAAYLVIMVLVGVYSVRRIQNTKDYYVAGRSFGPMVLMATVCATIIGGSGLMGRAGVAYTDGFKAVLTAIPYLLGMFIFSGIAGKISDIGMQYGITSIPELFERRFGRAAKITLSVLIAFAMMGTVASQVTATATIIRMLGGEFGLSYEMGALIATVVFMVYTATSGLFGVVYTDVLQFYMLIVFVYILIPVAALFNVGGLRTLRPTWTRRWWSRILTAAFWETSSPIWFSPWQVRKCGNAHLPPRAGGRQSAGCSWVRPYTA